MKRNSPENNHKQNQPLKISNKMQRLVDSTDIITYLIFFYNYVYGDI